MFNNSTCKSSISIIHQQACNIITAIIYYELAIPSLCNELHISILGSNI